MISFGFYSAEAAMTPCAQIKAACEKAGFQAGPRDQVPAGKRLWVDCVDRIMKDAGNESVQKKKISAQSSLQLPVVDSKLVSACSQGHGEGQLPKAEGLLGELQERLGSKPAPGDKSVDKLADKTVDKPIGKSEEQ